jgi:hypothetical protein
MSIIHGIIDQMFLVQQKINVLQDKKIAIGEVNQKLGLFNSMALSASPNTHVRFLPINFDRFQNGGFRRVTGVRPGEPGAAGPDGSRVDPSVYTIDASLQSLIDSTPGVTMDPAGAPSSVTMGMQPGELLMKKETAEAMYKAYFAKISAIEKEIDTQLERLKSANQALMTEMETFQKFLKDDIGQMTNNAYV